MIRLQRPDRCCAALYLWARYFTAYFLCVCVCLLFTVVLSYICFICNLFSSCFFCRALMSQRQFSTLVDNNVFCCVLKGELLPVLALNLSVGCTSWAVKSPDTDVIPRDAGLKNSNTPPRRQSSGEKKTVKNNWKTAKSGVHLESRRWINQPQIRSNMKGIQWKWEEQVLWDW